MKYKCIGENTHLNSIHLDMWLHITFLTIDTACNNDAIVVKGLWDIN